MLFHEYYTHWITIYKVGSVREVTLQKYRLTEQWIRKLIPHLRICDFDRIAYQKLINDYAETHSSINTTQKTYLHIIKELENKDIDVIMRSLSSLSE